MNRAKKLKTLKGPDPASLHSKSMTRENKICVRSVQPCGLLGKLTEETSGEILLKVSETTITEQHRTTERQNA